MSTQVIGRMLSVICIGLLAGVYLGDYVGVRHARSVIEASGFVQMQQAIHVRFVRLMPMLILGAVIGHLLWLWSLRAEARTLVFWLVLGGVLGIIAIAIMTKTVSVPLNQQLMTWTVTTPPADLHHLWQPWEQVNLLRLCIALAVLVLELALLAKSGTS